MGIDNISKGAGELSTWVRIRQVIIGITGTLIAIVRFILRIGVFLKRYRKSYKKKIYVVGDTAKFITELDLIKKSNLVDPKNIDKSYPELNDDIGLNTNSIVILCIDEGDTTTDKVESATKSLKRLSSPIPLIVYTYGNSKRLSDESMKTLADYKLFYVSNFPLNLLDGLLVSVTAIQ